MDTKKLTDEIVKTDRFKSFLSEQLARKVADEYHFTDSEGYLIAQEVRDLIKKEAEEMVREVVEAYYEMKPIRRLIQDEIKSMTRAEIINLITTK